MGMSMVARFRFGRLDAALVLLTRRAPRNYRDRIRWRSEGRPARVVAGTSLPVWNERTVSRWPCPGSAVKAYGLAPAEVWRDPTVFYRQYEWFALIGAPIDVVAIIAPFTLAFLVRDRKRCSRWLPPARPCLTAGLLGWFALSRLPTRY